MRHPAVFARSLNGIARTKAVSFQTFASQKLEKISVCGAITVSITKIEQKVRSRLLFSQAEVGDELLISGSVRLSEVFEQTRPSTDHLEQAATCGMVLQVCSEMPGQILDSTGENRNLNFRRARIFRVQAVALN